MNRRIALRMACAATLAVSVVLSGFADMAGAAELSKKKLQVFLLAGQSNMTGYCGIMPLTNLANYRELDDPALRALDKRLCTAVFPGEKAIKENNKIRAEMYNLFVKSANLRKQLAQAKNDKDEKAIEDLGKQIKDIGARTKELQANLQVAKAKRVYIAPDGRYGHKPGVLTFGYGRSDGSIGPEYGFGLTLEQKLDAPILLIKVAQDGASLAYNYRPPSSGPIVLTADQKKLDSPEHIKNVAKAKEKLEKVWLPKAKKAIADFWAEHNEFMAEHLNEKQYAEWRKQAAEWNDACNSPENGGPDELPPWKVEALENKAAEYFKGTDKKPPSMNYSQTIWKERPALADASDAQTIKNDAGKEYRRMVEFSHEVLENLQKYHPEYDPAVGYDFAGFVWFQGWSDNSSAYSSQYAQNMANLIRDLRKDLNAPDILMVSGTPSFGRTKEAYEANPVVVAQREMGKMAEFKGTVAIVETLQFYDHLIWPVYAEWQKRFPEWAMVGSNVACHYLGSGRFFVRLGDALSTAMVDMMKQQQARTQTSATGE